MRKNSGLLVLMYASVALLLVFQVLWLKQVYKEQMHHLERDASEVFTHTIRNMQDSIIRQHFLQPLEARYPSRLDSVTRHLIQNAIRLTLSRKRIGNLNYQYDTLQITKGDSNGNGVRLSLQGRIEEDSSSSLPIPPSVVFINSLGEREISTDSLKNFYSYIPIYLVPDSVIIKKFQTELQESNIQTNFYLKRFDPQTFKFDRPEVDSIFTRAQFLGVPPMIYSTTLIGYRPYLLKQLLPQTIFSTVLVGLIIFSFFIVYRSLKKERMLRNLKNDFINNITHELKTPITTVGVALEAIQQFQIINNPSRTKEYLLIAQQELQRLALLVDRVLKMSMFEQQAFDIKPERFNFTELVQSILNSFKVQLDAKKAQVQFLPNGHALEVEGDKIHLANMIYNLVDNALKYSKDIPQLSISLSDHSDSVELAVKDNGVGIPNEYRDKIFDKFFRVPTGDRHDVKGHGLGLHYVMQVVKQHHGSIQVQSDPGYGSTFIVHLPKHLSNK